jgi:hypothetical protein
MVKYRLMVQPTKNNHAQTPPHGSAKRLRKTIDRASLFVSVASTFVAVIAAAAAVWSVYEAHKTRVNDERPFVLVTPAPDPGAPPPIRLLLTETGKSPARRLRVSCETLMDTAEAKATWSPASGASPTNTFAYLLPTIWIKFACPSETNYTPPSEGTVVELGAVQYQDDRDNQYTTPFCFTFTVPYTVVDAHQCSENRNLPDLR